MASMTVEANNTFTSAYELLAPMWVEIYFMIAFILGFATLRFEAIARRKGVPQEPECQLRKTFEAEMSAGRPEKVLSSWRAVKARQAMSVEALKIVVQAFVETDPKSLLAEITEHIQTHRELGTSKTIAVVLDVVARAGLTATMEELSDTMQQRFGVTHCNQTYEVLLGGYASAGNDAKVQEILSKIRVRSKISARGYSLTIKGFLKNGMWEAALKQIQAMHRQGLFVPSFAITQLCRVACEASACLSLLDVMDSLNMSSDAVVVLMEDCHKRNDLNTAFRVEKLARQCKTPLLVNAYDSFLKLCVMNGDLYAIKLFEEMQASDIRISEGLCVGLLARCADSKFLRFAEVISKYRRDCDGMSISVYSALMKVYAYCGMYDKACDLYAQIKEEGLEPDSMMYGCLMKFSVECGRTELSQELFNKAPCLDIQNYMSLIRAARRDKDITRAFSVLEELKASAVTVDIAAYNCVLDVCVSAGDMKRARRLVEDMKTQATSVDIVTYNTLLKGFCNLGDIRSAKELLTEMAGAGHPPNDVSYNCLINAAVTTGNFREAWNTIEMMENSGVPVDHYTISIMMKALKKSPNARDTIKALALLDRSGLDVCSDEVLLNTVLETCIRHREFKRLENIVSVFIKSNLRPSVHTYGSLIKACSTLKTIGKCRDLWQDMTEHRAMTPNDIVLGCMLDALVCNDSVDEAITLFNKWKSSVPPNTVMYSTIIKGFANTRQSSRAMELFKEMKAMKVPMNTVVYNALIDSQARTGAMDEVSELVESMEAMGCMPDAITCSTIVKGYGVKGNLDKAFEVFRDMQRNNMAIDSVIYNTILDGCTRHNRMDLADVVLAEMEDNKIKPSNFTLGILVKMYGRRKQLHKAFGALEELSKKYGLQPNAQVKTCLMCACLNNNDIDKAYEVFEDIKSTGQGVDTKCYSILLQGNVRRGNLQEAARLVEEAYGIGQQRGLPTNQTLESEPLEQLMRALTQKGKMESVGMPLLERLRAAKVPVSSRLFSSITSQGNDDRSKR